MATKKTIIIIAGSTAVGKTAIAVEVATRFGTEIISADSRQCYKELKIGVARPYEKELLEVKHHFIASHSIHEKVTAATFENYALGKANEIFAGNDIAVMVGGTGLYIKAFCEGMDEIPEVPEVIRNEVMHQYKHQGLQWLQDEVKRFDAKFFEQGENKNPQRLMRALEVFKATGRSVLEFRKGKKAERDFEFRKVALELSKDELYLNIENRVDKMMHQGLVEEVRSLIPYQHLNALQTVGYKELFEHFNGQTDLPTAVELIKRNTKQYARRQMTWFRKDKEYVWLKPDANEVIKVLSSLQGA